ncbi:MAG: hypothetical protein GY801_22945 [bacterium]|nr:hypothetical protein [bacterium]
MKRLGFNGIHEHAFVHRLKRREYKGIKSETVIIETWYRLSFEGALSFIDEKDWIERKIEQGKTLPDAWIKLITCEYTNTITGETRRSRSTSLRPYVQGYGCDGSTDLNIHAIANRLAEQHGLDYPALLIRAYPGDFSTTNDFSWLNDDVVLAETIIPQNIDADLVLKDLQDINNYTLAEEFGIELYHIGAISTDWAEIRNIQDMLKKQIAHDVDDWFARNG